jgi:DNA repair exonuclease SbcCD ATPase subunit
MTSTSNLSQNTQNLLTPFSVKSNLSTTSAPKQNLNNDSNCNQIKIDSRIKSNDFFTKPPLFRQLNETKVDSNFEKTSDKQMDNKLSDGLSAEEITSDSSYLKERVAQEIEKIETWKAITELEMKKKNEQIIELKETNDQLRQRMTTIQSENNSLKISINAEVSEREEIVTKMQNTREMFVRVKNYVEHIENRLNSFEEIKHLMEKVNERRSQQFDDLTQKFLALDLNHQTIVSDLKQDLSLKESEVFKLDEELKKLMKDFNECKSEAENSFNALDLTLKSVNEQKESLLIEINELKEQLNAKNDETVEFSKKVDQLTQQLDDLNRLHESAVDRAEQKALEFNDLRLNLENEIKELQNKCQLLNSEKENFEKLINELENRIQNLNEENNQLLETKIEFNHTIDDLNSKLEAIEREKENIESNAENEKQKLQKSIEELETNVEILNEKNLELEKLKEENESLIENLESKANKTLIEKENVEKELRRDYEILKNEFEDKVNEYINKINDFENKIKDYEIKIEELEKSKAENETKINETLSNNEILKCEKENLEILLEKEKSSLAIQIANMTNILESCKTDYNKRIEDKEERIKEYKRESEKMQYNVEHLSKKCEKIEAEKAHISRKLQELTLSTLRTSASSPDRVCTPKFQSPIEVQRLSSSTSMKDNSQSLSHLSHSPILQYNDSFTKNDSQFKSKAKKVIEENTKQDVNNQQKQKNLKSKTDFNENTSNESVYEILSNNKLRKVSKKGGNNQALNKNSNAIRGKPLKPKLDFKPSVKVNMSCIEDDENTNEYDIESNDKLDEPLNKKFKDNLFELKTYSRKNVRVENILKGRPTPTKNNDLSWLNF